MVEFMEQSLWSSHKHPLKLYSLAQLQPPLPTSYKFLIGPVA